MRLYFRHESVSLSESVSDDELHDFVVLSGPNGAGKSNLLQAISVGAIQVDDLPPPNMAGILPGVRLFRPGSFAYVTDPPMTSTAAREGWTDFQSRVTSHLNAIRSTSPEPTFQEQEGELRRRLVTNHDFTQAGLEKLISAAGGKNILDFEPEDYRKYSPLMVGIHDPFALSTSALLMSYQARFQATRFQRWQEEQDGLEGTALTDAEFVDQFGPPPWELLAETLHRVGLEYSFTEPPKGVEDGLNYQAQLVYEPTGTTIGLDRLSSGEKTLLAVAMTLYAGSEWGEAVEMPKVLLLDEADATLHPSMVKSLLTTISEVFVEANGVKVILATHAPTTVALAPEESLYSMRRVGNPRLQKATRDEALRELTVGIPTLSVKVENRRQVFVEGEDDQDCYQRAYVLLKNDLDSQRSLEFIAAGKGGHGGRDAVLHLVRNLRDAGNDSVFGVIDRDNDVDDDQHADGIRRIGERYALENVILDPLGLGILLLRENLLKSTDVGLPDGLRAHQLEAGQQQALLKAVADRVADAGSDLTPHDCTYLDGQVLQVPAFWLNENGHALEARILETFPGLQRFPNKQLKIAIVELAWADVHGAIPRSVLDLFETLGEEEG